MIDKDAALSYLKWEAVPELKDPFLVAGFHGWSDAGSVSSDSLAYLMETLKPRVLATLSDEPFVNYTLSRPVAQIEDGIIHELEPATAEFMCWKNVDGGHDLVLFLGKEPHYWWENYALIVLEVIRRLRIQRLYTIGGVQDTVSHVSPPLVTAVGSSASVIARTVKLESGVKAADYYGPISIHSYLIKACADAGIEAVSLWGHVPAYLQKSPRLVAKMITLLNKAAGMTCSTEPLKKKCVELDMRINEALLKDPNLKRFVDSIERDDAAQTGSRTDDKVIRLNDFLRREPPRKPEE